MLDAISTIAGVALILTVLWETFETIVLPRRVTRQFRLTRFFYRSTWLPWSALALKLKSKKNRETLLAFYGPISLLLLFVVWAIGLLLGFALLHYGIESVFTGAVSPSRFSNALYMSGTTLFTLGLGDVTPASGPARVLTVLEAGLGFGFLALVIGYLPVLYQSFSRREVTISLLDARAGSPPTAAEMLRRHTGDHGMNALLRVLEDWERWSAELMESHLSYPVLAYFRSQHDNQSWLGSLIVILDLCSLFMVGLEGVCQYQAKMTFAITRHALVDLSQIFNAPPASDGSYDRLPSEELAALRLFIEQNGFRFSNGNNAEVELTRLRALYEPYAFSMARFLQVELPPWIKHGTVKDNWKTSAWREQSAIAERVTQEEHF